MKLINYLSRLFKIETAYAHCDIPCGIYDPISAKIAAQTVLKASMRLEAVDFSNGVSSVSQPNGVARLIHGARSIFSKDKSYYITSIL